MTPSSTPTHRDPGAPAPNAVDAVDAYVFPLSFSQQRLWFLNQLMPGTSVYNIPLIMRVQAPLNLRVLERSLNELVRRHEVLRTRFVVVDGEPMQAVVPALALTLGVADLRSRPAEVRELEAQQRVFADVQQPFDLATGPLFRASLVRLADSDHVLALAMHHIISDGWSINVIGHELGKLYEAFSAGLPSPLPELAIQYGDFASWQREWLRGEVLDTQLGYWRTQLEGVPPLLELPTDRPRPPLQSFRGASQLFAVPGATLAAIKQLAREQAATPFMVLLSAFYALLFRYSGQDDITIGSPIANRNRMELEQLVGFFTNTLVLRARITGTETFRQLIKHVREVTLGAYAHQDLPFEKLVEELQPARSLGHNPLFQVMFSLQNAPGMDTPSSAAPASRASASAPASAPASPAEPPAPVGGVITPAIQGSAKFDMTLSMMETPDGLASAWEYSTDLFDDATIARMIRHFGAVLHSALVDPDGPLDRIPLLGPAERHQLVTEWNATAAAPTSAPLLHRMFEDQVERAPDRIAVVARGAELSYGALNARADRLAQALRRRGVGPEVLVGIHLERSVDQIVAILAVLKAGGAYVPLDPSYPEARLAYMIEDSRMRVLVTCEALRGGRAGDGTATGIPAGIAAEIAILDIAAELAAEPGAAAEPALPVALDPENACYVIYTSGSTGRPKGVVIPHRAAVNHMAWMRDRWSFGPDSAILHKTPASFDASVWEIFVPLVSGGRLVLADPQGHRDPAYLVQTVLDEKVTDLQLVPSLLELVIAQPDLARCMKLRRMFAGGEALPRALVDRFMKRSAAEVVNLYGPTEVTIQSIVGVAAREPRPAGVTEPIGRPIHNLRAYVLDQALQPVPIGVPGELYLGGAGVARGYLHRSGLTAERFLPDPFDERGGRLYRTGDRARYLEGGNLEYVGRIDDQVKVRGFRIELGEIEAVLAQYPGVQAAAVIVREDTPGDQRITGYVVRGATPAGEAPAAPAVPEAPEAPEAVEDLEDLRRFLRERLPEYMVPAAIVALPALPRLASGKLDRRALPRPASDRPELGRAYVAPSTALEQVLAQIWIDILGVDRVGAADDFFALGGHSLLATQVVTRIRDVLQAEVALRTFFEVPTIAGIAAAILTTSRDPGRVEKTAELVLSVSTMSEGEVAALLREKQHTQGAEQP